MIEPSQYEICPTNFSVHSNTIFNLNLLGTLY